MKRVLLLSFLLFLATSVARAQRLPQLAAPENYRLTIAPDFSKDNFTGEEFISIRVLKPTIEIFLNSAEIEIRKATVNSDEDLQKATVSYEPEKEMVSLKIKRPIKNEATIYISYTGVLNSELRGLYLGRQANGEKYAVTQFEATDARRAFPSFDEPAYKATFNVTLIAEKAHTAISNGKVVSDIPGPGNGKHTVHFATTPKMSSYLVALAVGNFEYVEGTADGIPIRIYTAPGKTRMADFALEVSERCLRYFNEYFTIKYPFQKLDMIAVPDFSSGAMENTGAIIYSELDLLLDSKHASTEQRKNVATTVAHEMAHQWFGDLVTMAWWDDLWLNEGFANWMQNKPLAAWKPDWNLNLDEVTDANTALDLDSLANTRPIRQAAETPEQINELFDNVAYKKGAAVLNMVEAYLGPKVFQTGVNEYLARHAYGNATASDFWNTLAAVSRQPVDHIMATFVEMPGAPMVKVRAQCKGSASLVTLSQTRYFYDRSLFAVSDKQSWVIPICLRTRTEQGGEGERKCQLLTKPQESVTLPGCVLWTLANPGATGYYRAAYEPEATRAMSHSLETDLTAAERIRLLSDEWASVRVGRQSIEDYLEFAEGMGSELNGAVMEELTGQLKYIGDYLIADNKRASYQRWVIGLLTRTSEGPGWQPAPGESDDRKALRAYVLFALGYTGRNSQVLAEAARLAQVELKKTGAVDPIIVGTLFELAVLNGDASLYNQIMDRMKKTSSPEEYSMLLGSLSRFSDSALLQRTLQFSLTPEVRAQDVHILITGVMRNPSGRQMAWNFVREHWAEIEKIQGTFNSETLVESMGSFCDARLHDEVRDFFTNNPVPAADRTLRLALERVNYCIDLKSQQGIRLSSWLDRHGGGQGSESP
jgi:puromycin-sensitive aminopeptidase